VAAKSGQFTTDETGKGQFLRGNQRNLAEEGFVRKASLPVHFREVQHDLETYWKLRTTREERESKRFQISQKDFGWRNVGAEERRVRADWESVMKGPIESDVILDESASTSLHLNVVVRSLPLYSRGRPKRWLPLGARPSGRPNRLETFRFPHRVRSKDLKS